MTEINHDWQTVKDSVNYTLHALLDGVGLPEDIVGTIYKDILYQAMSECLTLMYVKDIDRTYWHSKIILNGYKQLRERGVIYGGVDCND